LVHARVVRRLDADQQIGMFRDVESAQNLSESAGREFRRSTGAVDHLSQTHRLPSFPSMLRQHFYRPDARRDSPAWARKNVLITSKLTKRLTRAARKKEGMTKTAVD
jgi:hypothetical protein